MDKISKAASILGRKGGSSKSMKKAAAVRENGKRGGRPKSRAAILIEQAQDILIFSGEGEAGIWRRYTGAKTLQAVKTRATRERSGGDRWASVWISRGYNQADTDWPIYDEIDLSTGDIGRTRDINPDEII